MHKTAAEARRLLQVARGELPADLVLTGGRLLNVYTGEIQEDCGVAVSGRFIAYAGPHAERLAGPGTEVVAVGGRHLVPGLVDAHTHALWRLEPTQTARAALAGGTTTLVSEIMELACIAGEAALEWAVATARTLPCNLFVTIPTLAATLPEDRPPRWDPLRFLGEPEVLGIGEMPWVTLFEGPPEGTFELAAASRRARRAVEGHGAGARWSELAAFAAAGYGSCHEPITAEQVAERLRLGMWAMIRQGSIRQDLEGTHGVRTAGVDLRRLILCTDSVAPADLRDRGYLDAAVRRAIELGFPAVEAYRMASLNAAERFGLSDLIGGIAPGRLADLAVVETPGAVPERVYARGALAALGGRPLVRAAAAAYPAAFRGTANHGRRFAAADFPTPAGDVRVIDQVADLVTREATANLAGSLPEGVAHAVAAGRGRNAGRFFHGFVRGLGLREGAIATSLAWDTAATVAVGRDPTDLALALNRVAELDGGAVIARGGGVLWEMPCAVGGVIAEGDLDTLAGLERAGTDAAAALGCPWRNPLLTVEVLTTVYIPHLRLSYRGYVRVKDGTVSGW